MRYDGAIMVGVVGGRFDRTVLGWAAEEAVARHADLLVCHVQEQGNRALLAPASRSRPDRLSSSSGRRRARRTRGSPTSR